MKQISTGAGLLGLGVCVVAAAFIATHRVGGQAFAQGTGAERRIVSASVYPTTHVYQNVNYTSHFMYRIWSDNSVDLRYLGQSATILSGAGSSFWDSSGAFANWRTVDNGTSGFRPLTDVDNSGEVDGGDISAVLLDMNTRSSDLPPPPIDCSINAPR